MDILQWAKSGDVSYWRTCGTVSRCQAVSGPSRLIQSLGFWTFGSRVMFRPLSRTATCTFGSSESLLARTMPAVPPPTMMKSALWSMPPIVISVSYWMVVGVNLTLQEVESSSEQGQSIVGFEAEGQMFASRAPHRLWK